MIADIRGSRHSHLVQALYSALWQPGTNTLINASDLHTAGSSVYFTGTTAGFDLDSPHTSCIYEWKPGHSAQPCFDGAHKLAIRPCQTQAALVFRHQEGADEVQLRQLGESHVTATWRVEGTVELLQWSPDGRHLLLLVAGHSADVAGVAGGFSMRGGLRTAAWLPDVSTPAAVGRWRNLWIWTHTEASPRPLTVPPCNPWEACWCGNDAVLAVVSDDHGEGSWYRAKLSRLSLQGAIDFSVAPDDQLGHPTCTPSGDRWAWIEAVCSDRGLVCGTVKQYVPGGEPHALHIANIEATHIVWRDDQRLLVSGLRGQESVVAEWNCLSGDANLLWSSSTHTFSGWQPQICPLGEDDALVIVESFDDPPQILMIGSSAVRTLLRCGLVHMPEVGRLQPIDWRAKDGECISGWLLLPESKHPRPAKGWPLLVDVHGGPISAHRPRWAANARAAPAMAQLGWAVLMANPRGSSGRGQSFARQVIGDMGGADLTDLLAGIDFLIEQGLVDRSRVAITGSSYGGFMSCWAPTQSDRFFAAVAISPVTHWVGQHFGSQIPWFDTAFLKASPWESQGPYTQRSPLMFARQSKARTLLMAGGRDKNTPPSQAIEFYNALLEVGANCALAVYPHDGHSLRGMPAYIDSASRTVHWLTTSVEYV